MDQGSNLHEIERKWVVPQDLFNKVLMERRSSVVTAKSIEQAYLAVNDMGEDRYESRVMSTSNYGDDEPYKFQHDTKIGSGVKRLETYLS